MQRQIRDSAWVHRRQAIHTAVELKIRPCCLGFYSTSKMEGKTASDLEKGLFTAIHSPFTIQVDDFYLFDRDSNRLLAQRHWCIEPFIR